MTIWQAFRIHFFVALCIWVPAACILLFTPAAFHETHQDVFNAVMGVLFFAFKVVVISTPLSVPAIMLIHRFRTKARAAREEL